jgi:glycosyltransferase involved in cell wall biosynthesis
VIQRSWALCGRPSAERIAPGADLVHTPDLVPPPTRHPLVLTLHDLIALDRPDLHPPRSVALQRRQLQAARDRAAVVICVSQATADAACSADVDPARVAVVENGVTTLPSPDPSITPHGRFVLAVGSLHARKGLETLIAAFARADLPRDVRLVLAGPPGWNAEQVHTAIAHHDLDARVVCTGRVTDAQLASLYEQCLAVCVPSIAEGFGLPVLEAASAGATVVASDLPVFRELDGAVALYAPVGDRAAWTSALERIIVDDELRWAAARNGPPVAGRYTWDRSAERTAAAYEQAVRIA